MILPPAISILLIYLETQFNQWSHEQRLQLLLAPTYWSKKGSNTTTSSPGSMNAMKALSMPSLAPVVIVTSLSGSILRPQKGE